MAQQPVSTPTYAPPPHTWGSYQHHSNSPNAADYFSSHGSSRDSGYHAHTDPRNVRPRISVDTPRSYPPHSPSHLPPHPNFQHQSHSYSHPPPDSYPHATAMSAAGPSRRARSSSSQSQDGDEGSSPTQGGKGRGGGQGPKTIQSKACVNCRRSKVKCVNDGSGGPCRRCVDIKLECKWRVRIDDEAWRESVESRFSQLCSKVDAITAMPPAGGRKSDCAPSPSASGEVYQHPEWRNLHNRPGAMLPPPTVSAGRQLAPAHSPSYSSLAGSMHKTSPRPDIGSSASTPFNAVSPQERLPPPAALISGADVTMSNGDYSSWTPSGRARSISSVKMDGSSPSRFLAGRDSKVTSPLPGISQGFVSSQNRDCASMASVGPIADQESSPQNLPDVVRHAITTKSHGLPVQWEAGSYASAVSHVGRDDPRLNLIGTGHVPCQRVTLLFQYFGKYMQSHSFGFPTFAPNEKMTPLIVASISLAASLLDPAGRKYSPVIGKLIAEQANLAGADSLSEEQHLNRELGVGVEEITGLCIAATWLSGEEGNKLAKVVRFWALAYLRQFDARMDPQSSPADREQVYAEKMTLLPAYRVVRRSLRLRIWLESYIVDAAASIMNSRDLFAPGKPARPICEELREELSKSREVDDQPTRPEGLSAEDVQLLGHASIMDFFVATTNVISASRDSEHAMRELQYLLEEKLEDWRDSVGKDIDLSSNTPLAIDLGLTYYLARAYVGSLAQSINSTSGSPRSTKTSPKSTRPTRLQRNIVNQGKESALMALQIVQESLPERLLRLPTWQHFLLSHAGGLLIRVLEDPAKWHLTAQSYHILTTVESYARLARTLLDTHRAQTPCSFSSASSSSAAEVDSLPPYTSTPANGNGNGNSLANETATAGAAMMTARASSSSSSSTAVDVGASSGAGGGIGAKDEEHGEAGSTSKHVGTAAAATATYGGHGAHPAAVMVEEMYWAAVQMRCRIVG
ncbi:hypothetical protein BCV69DRAFT_284454 [Microstroma glucosiphilum]|uniref:Zn(2)-C6 fungal-type domain-containing protein n=1 Tax=Pseudomicrostroma glucosiphilum TaxID=1684307 RepID=A0A316U3B0_9BASI|nr:hypothetical protein BCV69DRAFT_284454 [Pseudomicrostroma glucosiphilum]PWN19308.1 hypothetical protein BCV69DRAFT_284454 [Pseudomicrostroma glucosiphilum]